MPQRHNALLGFFYTVIKDTSKEGLAEYREFLREMHLDEDEVRKARIDDEDMKQVLKGIGYSKKIRQAIEEDELPEHVRAYIGTFLSFAESGARAFFAGLKPKPKSYTVKEMFDNAIQIIAARSFFSHDKRILAAQEDVFRFHLGCYYIKPKKELSVSMTVRFEVEEKEIRRVSSEDLILFDNYIEAIGLGDGFAKSVQFNATVSEGETFYDNICEVSWTKTLEM